MSKIRNTIIIGVIGLVLTFLGIILPYFTISVFGYGTSISLFGYWEGKVILVLLLASLLFICKDYIEKFLPQLFDSGLGSKIKDANPKFVLIPTILMAVFAIWLFFSIEIDMTYIKYGIGFPDGRTGQTSGQSCSCWWRRCGRTPERQAPPAGIPVPAAGRSRSSCRRCRPAGRYR